MLIDANVFAGFFQSEMGNPHLLQGCPKSLMQTASEKNPIHHDEGNLIEHEWRKVVDPDWFDAWLIARLQDGTISILPTTYNASVESKLSSLGFPKSRDIVYVRLGLTIVKFNGACDFFTEDIDFFDPSKKGCASTTRKKILTSSSGPVCKLLSKNDINVTCVP